ncbi:Hpt domain-containing protein [Clostridium sp. C8-1-8]|uniref:Hpt domain-containing protein n=1 Tax=Clostridium sp. C8-1-8 TaxID=2698831 RepID=UPI0013705520|nr:Hpt domain-containing protein [Clostridium sp. C8-1-8]
MHFSEKYLTVEVKEKYRDLVPIFLSARLSDVEKLEAAVETSDFETIGLIGHSIYGASGSYGFHFASKLGEELEAAAVRQNNSEIVDVINSLKEYLASVKVTYID